MKARPTSLAVVAAVNDDEVLTDNLAASPMLAENGVPLIIERGYQSAALAYNAGLNRTTADVVIFAHQDVYLPRGWDRKLLSNIEVLESDGKKWAVLGVIGKDATGRLVGRAWSTGLGCKIETEFSSPTPVASVDELVIVVRKKTGLRFDANLLGYHLYGTDIVQTALQRGFEAYVFDGPVVHNSLPVVRLDRSYRKAYRYMQQKWGTELPICTTILPIEQSSWPLFRCWLSAQKSRLLGRDQQRKRHTAPAHIAQNLGYEEKDEK